MGLLDKLGLTGPRPSGRTAGEARAHRGNLEPDAGEGRLDPQTAALMDGAPPASASGRAQPRRRGAEGSPAGSTDPAEGGASEADANHLPG